jgi:Trypsin-like peptidase domain
VAPSLILTCAHVVQAAVAGKEPICVIYGGRKYVTKQVKPTEIFVEDDNDLVLLQINLKKHPCVLLGITGGLANTELHSYGFTLIEGDKGEEKTVAEEFRARFEGERKELKADLTFGGALTKFREGQVKSGYSGAPLLDLDAGIVVGVVSMTRGKNTDLGGFAIPTPTIYSLFPRLKKLNEQFHKENPEWKNLIRDIQSDKPVNPIAARLYTEPATLAYPENFVERSNLLQQIEKLLEKEAAMTWQGLVRRPWQGN